MRPPYPIALVPLLPQFLTRRRGKADFPLRAMERLGVDRPAYFFAMDLGNVDPRGARPEDIGNATYRTSDEPWRGAAAMAEAAGLVRSADGRWSLTGKGRDALAELRAAMDAHYASLAPIAGADLKRLAGLLEQALAAAATSAEPRTRDHTQRAARYRWRDPASAFARLDAAVYGLWQVRDDCHAQAWRDAGLAGPVLDVLTRLWRKEAATGEELATKILTQKPEDVRAATQQLRGLGLLASGLTLTEQGAAVRDRIEAETDRYFFAPWPDAVADEAGWIADRLGAVNAGLT